jgi:uncharacterized LabA/DUF88 family protein
MGPPSIPPIPPIFFQKVMFFVDGTNLLTSLLKDIGIHNPSRKRMIDKHSKIVIEAAANLLNGLYTEKVVGQKPYRVIRKYWFSSFRGQDRLNIEISKTLRNEKFNFEPILFKREGKLEKGVDISLTMTLLLNAFNHNFDIGLLVSGDEDYLELVNEVKRYGVRIEGAFLDYGLSEKLSLAFDRFYKLKPPANLDQEIIKKLVTNGEIEDSAREDNESQYEELYKIANVNRSALSPDFQKLAEAHLFPVVIN